MNEPAVAIEDLWISYGAIQAVKGVTIKVPEGQVVAILGANGAGKTSTLRCVSGLTRATGGRISLFGRDITNQHAERITQAGIAQSPEGRQIFRDLTVEENLRVGGFTVRRRPELERNFERVYGYFPRLAERRAQMAYTLSGGELQMLAIGRALMASPRVLLLDEPSLGLAPMVVQDIFRIIGDIKAEGTTVLIVEQNARQTLKIADYGYVLNVGRNHLEGPAGELARDATLVEAYLGSST